MGRTRDGKPCRLLSRGNTFQAEGIVVPRPWGRSGDGERVLEQQGAWGAGGSVVRDESRAS